MVVITGICAADGVAAGALRYLDASEQPIVRKDITDVETEIARFEKARFAAQKNLDRLFSAALNTVGAQNAAIFEIHKMLLDDLDYIESVIGIIRKDLLNAEYAVQESAKTFAATFSALDDAYMRNRAADMLDASNHVLCALGVSVNALTLDAPAIIIAGDMPPSAAVGLDREMILGFATVKGSPNSHTAILARSMSVPAAVNLGEQVNRTLDGKRAILDGGTLYIEPDDETQERLEEKRKAAVTAAARRNALKGKPSVTKGGVKVSIYANAGNLADIAAARHSDAEGIGLFRSEFFYLEHNEYPTEGALFNVYRRAVESMDGKLVVIRTLDIGTDKQVSYFNLDKEENPAMGLRAIRVCLTRPDVFRTQLRALYRASVFGNMAIMFPMITSAWEVEEILKIRDKTMVELDDAGIAFNPKTQVGIMIETPAAVMIADELAEMADFFSIGTNDLTQYTLAIDRQNAKLERFYDPCHPAVLKQIEMTVKSAHKSGIWAGICGELAADLSLTEIFLKMGVDEFSVSPRHVLALRERVIEAP